MWPKMWRSATGAGRTALRMLTGDDTVKKASDAALFGMSGATTHFRAKQAYALL